MHETSTRHAWVYHDGADHCSILRGLLGSSHLWVILGITTGSVVVKCTIKPSKVTAISKREFMAQVIQYMNMVEDLMLAYKAKPVELMKNFHKPTFQTKHKLLKKMVDEL